MEYTILVSKMGNPTLFSNVHTTLSHYGSISISEIRVFRIMVGSTPGWPSWAHLNPVTVLASCRKNPEGLHY